MSQPGLDIFAVSGLSDVLKAVNSACRELEIDFFILGAIAKNRWLFEHGAPVEGTKDIDLGVYVPSEDVYGQLRNGLTSKFGFSESRQNPFCLFAPNSREVDILPFGEINLKQVIHIQNAGLINIEGLEGLREVYEKGKVAVDFPEGRYYFSSIPGLLILKLVAFDDRPTERTKDARDIFSILKHYHSFEQDFLLDKHIDLFDGQREWQEISMLAIGREVARILEKNPSLNLRIIRIINDSISLKNRLILNALVDSKTETAGDLQTWMRYILQTLLP